MDYSSRDDDDVVDPPPQDEDAAWGSNVGLNRVVVLIVCREYSTQDKKAYAGSAYLGDIMFDSSNSLNYVPPTMANQTQTIVIFSSIQGIAQSLHDDHPDLPLREVKDEALGSHGGTVRFDPSSLRQESIAILKGAQILISEPAIIDRLLEHPLVPKHANGSGPDLRLEHRTPATAILPIDAVHGALWTAHRRMVHRLHHSAPAEFCGVCRGSSVQKMG